MDLEFENQMEVAQLKHPAAALGEKVHTPKVVDDKSPNPCLRMRRNSGNNLFPPRRALLAGKEQGIEEESRMARAGLEGGQIQDPGLPCELEPKAIGQQDQRPAGDFLRTRPADKATQRLSKSITNGRQGQPCPPLGELTEHISVQEDLVEKRRRYSMPRAASPPGPGRPRSLAESTLATSRSESSNPGSATGGFRMFCIHTCELSRTPNDS